MEHLGADLAEMRRVPLADEHVAAIARHGIERGYEAGAMVVEVGQPMERFIYLLDGEIEVVDPYSGGRMIEATLGATQFMGDIGFLNGGNWLLGMRATRATRTLEVERADMLALMARVPELSDHIITVYSARRRRQFEMHASAIKLIGADRDAAVQKVEQFLSRNRLPFQSYDLEASGEEARRLCHLAEHKPSVIYNGETLIDEPTPRKVARLLNLDLDIEDHTTVDLLIVGGGPSGVAAAVYAGAEGLSALLVEDAAIGGQAGTSSRIENYMGFPTGISGADLVYRGQIQALKFGTRFAMPRRVTRLERDGSGVFQALLDDEDTVCARAVLVSTGIQYRRLPLDRLAEFEGAGVFYAATDMEARFCHATDAVVVGGGNSAGQAAMFLSRHARHVHILVRGESLGQSMSDYLARRLEADERITISYCCEVSALDGEEHLESVTISGEAGERRIDSRALFVMIGAAPNTGWLADFVKLDGGGYVFTGKAAGRSEPFETSAEGIYAVGDVRAGSVKRVAAAVGEGSVVVSAIWKKLNEAEHEAA